MADLQVVVAYKRDCSNAIVLVRAMIVAIFERNKIGGLGKEIDLLKNRHLLAQPNSQASLADRAIKAFNNHLEKIFKSVLQVFN